MTVLISGVSSGIGKATAEMCLKNGQKVIGIDIKQCDNPQIRFFQSSISDDEKLSEIYKVLKIDGVEIDVIVDVAGIFVANSVVEESAERIKKSIDVNIYGTVLFNNVFFPLLKKGGRIVIVTSEVGNLSPMPFNVIYTTTKHALEAYARGLRQELNLLGYSVVVIRPGAIATDLLDGSVSDINAISEQSEYFKDFSAGFNSLSNRFMGKPAQPADVAKMIYKGITAKKPKLAYEFNNSVLFRLISFLPDRLQLAVIKKMVSFEARKIAADKQV